MTRTFTLALLFLGTALPAAADTILDRDAAACAQDLSDSRITLSDSAVSFWESSCDIATETADASGARDLTLTCYGEGEEWTSQLRIEQTATGYRLSTEAGASDYVACN